MNERSPLLHPSADSPAVVVHQVQHDAMSQMGLCCMNDGIKTDTLCEICSAWICKSHFRFHRSNREEVHSELVIPCISTVAVPQTLLHPVCPNCEYDEERPPGYPKYYVNTMGKVSAVLVVLIVVVIAVFALMN